MTQINQNIDNSNLYAMQQAGQMQSPNPSAQRTIRVPEYYQLPPERMSFKESMEANPFMMLPYQMFIKPLIEHPLPLLGTWIASGMLLDKYTKACGGEYEKSLLGRTVKFGDKIQNSQFFQSPKTKSTLEALGSVKTGWNKLVEHSAILRAMKYTKSQPEWEMAKSEMLTQRQRIVHDFKQITEKLKLTKEGYVPLSDLGLTKAEKKMLKEVSNSSNLSEAEKSVRVQLSRLGWAEEDILNALAKEDKGVQTVKDKIISLTEKNADWFKKLGEDPTEKMLNEVQEVSGKLGGKVKIGLGEYKLLGMPLGWITKPFQRNMGCDEIHNRMRSISKESGPLGRFFAKSMQMIHRGLTFGGGKLGLLLFIAPGLVESAINVRKAENKQKVSTGISSFVNHISWVITFPLALKIMHSLGGIQYAGMSEEEVRKCRKIRNAVNKANKKGVYAKDKEKYKFAVSKAKEQIKAIEKKAFEESNILTKCLKKLARFMCLDLERFDGRNTKNPLYNKFTKVKNLPRNIIGVPMRFIIWGLISMGVLDTAINKGIKFMFGEPYNYEKEEERKDNKKQQEKFLKEDLNKRMYNILAQQQLGTPGEANVQQLEGLNGLAARGRKPGQTEMPSEQRAKVDNYGYVPSQKNVIQQEEKKNSQDNYSYIPSQNNIIQPTADNNQANNPNMRTYIPSQEGANVQKIFDNSGLNEAMSRADKAEQKALRILSGNFEGM